MCGLCSQDPFSVEAAKERLRNSADELEKLANLFRNMARGYLKPHTDDGKRVACVVRSVIRKLVDEWV